MSKLPKILFVLDSSSEQQALETSFQSSYALDFCYDAADSIKHIELTKPSVVVLSYQDDGVSPLAIAHILRQNSSAAYVGLIYISQAENNDWLDRLINAGVDVCLPEGRTILQTKTAIDTVLKLCGAKSDILQLNQKLHSAYQRLKNQSFTDTVTGFGNRLFMQNQLRLEFKRAQRYQKNLILLLLRIDHLEIETAPSMIEENLLSRVSDSIRSTVRFEIDFTGRSRESEFFVICPETSIDGAISVAERLRIQIAKLHKNSEGKHLSCSVGVAHFDGDRGNFADCDEFFETAEAAVQTALHQGGDQYCALDTPTESISAEQSREQSA